MNIKKIIFFLIFVINVNIVYTNEIEDMQNEVKKIEEGISEKKQQIEQVNKEQEEHYKNLRVLDRDLKVLENDYNKIESKLKALNRNIEYGERTLKMVEEQMDEKSLQINSKILIWYKYGSKQRIEYIASGHNYFDVLDRQENLKKILNHDKQNINNIAGTKSQIEQEKTKIESNKEEVELLKKDLNQKKKELDVKRKERNNILRKLRNQKSYYENEVKKLNTQKQEIEKKIQDIILSKTKTVKDMSIEEILNEIDYMVYPLEGEIAVKFGELKAGRIKSTAIEIKSELGARIQACAKGKVIFSGKFQNLGKVVIIDHGYNLVSVYGNMIHNYVKVGDDVEREQNIGVLGMSTNERDARLYFELRSKAISINPLLYLKK